jgi:hypothetical protein
LVTAVATRQVQHQVKSLACGSVVDALYEPDLATVLLPTQSTIDGAAVSRAWKKFSDASKAEATAYEVVESSLAEVSGI